MKFKTITLGCKVNSYETEAIICDLVNRGWTYLNKEDEKRDNCDVCIINTCTVTSMSDQKSRQVIRNMRRKNPHSVIVAMGCYVQLHENQAAELADIIIGTHNRLQVYELVNSYIRTRDEIKESLRKVEKLDKIKEYENLCVDKLNTHTRGFIKIQDGCENFCSYCAIPYARGKIRSRDPQSIIEEIQLLVNSGTKEVIISGINTGCYGQDLNDMTLGKLIIRIMEETTLYRLRISSIELMEITPELLDVIQKYSNRIANHFHIPLQGGCNTVLQRMNRKYAINEYREIIKKIRSINANVAITTDFLAGFVGETEEEFEQAKNFISEMKFASMHIFPYSRREGTKADLMKGHLQDSIKTKRASELQKIAQDMKVKYQEQFINMTMEIVVENQKQGYWHGHSSNYLDIYFLSKQKALENQIVNVKITEIKDQIIYGTLQRGEER